MKDKLKGLIIGICIGSMVAGTAVYASGTSIQVTFSKIKYLFDGIAKTPTGNQGFNYNGTIYVPLRFVADALGKQVQWDASSQTVTINTPTNANNVAVYKGGTITSDEFAKFLSIAQLCDASASSSLSDPDFKSQVLNQTIAIKILADRGKALEQTISPPDISATLMGLKTGFDAAFNGSPTWDQRLNALNLTDADMVTYLTEYAWGDIYLKSLIPDTELQHEYITNLPSNAYLIASVSQILIALVNPDGTPRSQADALAIADSVEKQLANGADFAAMAKQYSDDPGSKDNGGQYLNVNVNDWVDGFKQAVIDLPLHKISDPVLSEYGYHIIRVDAKTTASFDDVRDRILNSLANSAFTNFIKNDLPGLIISTNIK